MAIGDVYEVTDVQELQGQQVLNVYFYRQGAAFVPFAGTIAQALADEFVDTIVPAVAAVQSQAIVHIEVRVRNLFDDTDSGIAVAGIPGGNSVGTAVLPSFTGAGFQLNTDNSAVRPGAKRTSGHYEAQQDDGVWLAGTLTNLNNLGDIMAEPITGGLIIQDDIMFPIVVQRVRSGAPGSYTYRLPETPAELVFGNIIEALVKTWVTSQVSRKFGVGL